MSPKNQVLLRAAAVFVVMWSSWILAQSAPPAPSASEADQSIERYASGLFKSATFERGAAEGDALLNEETALRDFLGTHNPGDGFRWVLEKRLEDATHAHRTYQLHYGGRRVLDVNLKTHFNRQGWIEYASSNHSQIFSVALPSRAQGRHFDRNWVRRNLLTRGKSLVGDVRSERVIWLTPGSGVPVAAVVVRFLEWQGLPRVAIVDEASGRVLEEKRVVRTASATATVYKISPSHSSPESVTLGGLTDTASLKDSYIRVRREQPDTTTSPTGVTTLDVTPMDFTGVSGFSTSPGSYNYSCEATGGSLGEKCPNQGFDAVNVYYHLNAFRTTVVGHFATLGVSPTFTYDPLNVLINPLSISTSSNNAAYVGEPCRSDGSMDRCLIFLRPDTLSGSSAQSNCAKSSSQFYDLAREGLVVAHEYQHYVTDVISGIVFSSSSSATFGDALHEGYSDYLAASHLTRTNGSDVTLVGQYALQDCAPLQREVGTLRVYGNGTAEEDPHTSGLSWASGLWQLREEFGADIGDLLALKSLFFLSTNPGALEAVEAVVKADKAVYAGAHVTRIRQIFYSEIKFIGGSASAFEDPAGKVVDVGLKGCGAVSSRAEPLSSGLATLFVSMILLIPLLFTGRRLGGIFLLVVTVGSLSFADMPAAAPKFSRNCHIFAAPTPGSSIVCTQKAGTEIKSTSPGGNGFVLVETPACTGYLFVTCVSGLDARVQSGSIRRFTSESKGPPKKASVVMSAHFDGPWGKSVSGSTPSKGLGFGAQLSYLYPVSTRIFVAGGPLFEYLKLGRAVDGSGALVDPNPTNFDQSVLALGAQAKVQYLVEGREGYGTGPEWWGRFGLEFWWPMSAKQTDSTGDEVTYSPGKFLVATLGPMFDINLSHQSSLVVSGDIFYNIARLSAPTFYGIRVAVALRYSL